MGSKLGLLHGLKDGIDIKRLQIAYPLYKLLVDIYKPLSLNGSILQDKTSDLEYADEPTLKQFECIITNLEHYEKSDVIFESFEEDKTLMKILAEYPSEFDLPIGSKIVVLDASGRGYKTYIVDEKPAITSVLNDVIAFQYELTPSYLINTHDSLLSSAKRIKSRIDSGGLLDEEVTPEEVEELKLKEFSEEDILVITEDGGLYYE